VRVRSTQPPQPASLSSSGHDMTVTLRDGEHGVAPGQACVFYADGLPRARVLGGGFIARTIAKRRPPADASPSGRTFEDFIVAGAGPGGE